MKRLAATLERVRLTRARNGKEAALAELFATLEGPALAAAARLAVGLALPTADPRSVGVGWAKVFEAAVQATGWDPVVLRACSGKCGDASEAIALLLARLPDHADRTGYQLDEVAALFDALADAADKRPRVEEILARATPLEAKYLLKILLGGLRTGAMGGVVEGAIARAFALEPDAVRAAGAMFTDPGELAVAAREGRLDAAAIEIGRPVAYMLATPIETIASALDPTRHVVEDKLDGIRAQVHKRGREVAVFARGLERVTESFPEVVEALAMVPGSFVVDGEIVAVHADGRVRPFQALQARLGRKRPTRAQREATRVTFIVYDLLADGDRAWISAPWTERRARLIALGFAAAGLTVNEARPLGGEAIEPQLEREFEAARARGHEGLVLKRVDAAYEPGRRGQAWIKVKKAFATLDVVVTAAEEGHGKRAGLLSDYTFAVRRGDTLVNVGKAYSGVTDAEIARLTELFQRTTLERFGRVRIVKPEVVMEVAFDGLQRSKRHASGFSLRFPRIVRLRDDKRPEDADSIETVEALFAAQVDTGHREEAPPAAQLSLFGAPSATKKG